MAITFTVNLRGRPLRRTYVSHFDFFRSPQTVVVRTDELGRATIGSVVSTSQITVRVHAQNAVVRVLDGNFPIPVEVSQEFAVADQGTINIHTAGEQQDHFTIMDSCLDVYDTVWRQFRPFNRPGRGAFPFGTGGSPAQDRERLPRIEVVYPDNGPAAVAFVEPVSLGTGHPLIHLKHKSVEPRLFGSTTPPTDPTGVATPDASTAAPSKVSRTTLITSPAWAVQPSGFRPSSRTIRSPTTATTSNVGEVRA